MTQGVCPRIPKENFSIWEIEHISKILIFRITVSPTAWAKKASPPAISIHTPIANPFRPSIRFVACTNPPDFNTVNTVAPRRVE